VNRNKEAAEHALNMEGNVTAKTANMVSLACALLLGILVLVPWVNMRASASMFGYSESRETTCSLLSLYTDFNSTDGMRMRKAIISSFHLALMFLGPVAMLLIAGATVASSKRNYNIAGVLVGIVFCIMLYSVINNMTKERSNYITSISFEPAFGAYSAAVIAIAYTIFQGLPLGMRVNGYGQGSFSAQEFGTQLGQLARNVATNPQLRQLGRNLCDAAANVGSGVATTVKAAAVAAQGDAEAGPSAPRRVARAGITLPTVLDEEDKAAMPDLAFVDEDNAAGVPFREIAAAFLQWQKGKTDDRARAFSALMRAHKEKGLQYSPERLKDDVAAGMQASPMATLGKVLYTHYQLKKIVAVEKVLLALIPKAMAEMEMKGN